MSTKDTQSLNYKSYKQGKDKELKEYLRRVIATHGAATTLAERNREIIIKSQIKDAKLKHNELKAERDRLYTERKVLKKELDELEKIARTYRERLVVTDETSYEGQVDVFPSDDGEDEGEVTSVEQLKPGI